MVAPEGSTISLVIQIVVLALLIVGYTLKRQNKFRQHGITMLSAVVLHIVSILAVMIPSFALFFAEPGSINYADATILVTLVHVASGVIAAALGIFLVGAWHLKSDIKPCFKRKRIMDVTIILWLLAIILGIIIYMIILQTS